MYKHKVFLASRNEKNAGMPVAAILTVRRWRYSLGGDERNHDGPNEGGGLVARPAVDDGRKTRKTMLL